MNPDKYTQSLVKNLGKVEAKRVAAETLKQAESSSTNILFWKQVVNILKK